MKAVKKVYPQAKSFKVAQYWSFGQGWRDVEMDLTHQNIVGLAEDKGATAVSIEVDGKFRSDFAIKELL